MRKYRSYKFTNKKHSVGGVRSSIAALVSLFCTVVSVACAYVTKGNVRNYLVIFCMLAFVSSIYGIFAGRKSYREEECYYLFSHIGTILSLILMVFWVLVIALGVLA